METINNLEIDADGECANRTFCNLDFTDSELLNKIQHVVEFYKCNFLNCKFPARINSLFDFRFWGCYFDQKCSLKPALLKGKSFKRQKSFGYRIKYSNVKTINKQLLMDFNRVGSYSSVAYTTRSIIQDFLKFVPVLIKS